MKDLEQREKKHYTKPMVLATYSKEDLEESIRPHGSVDSYTICTGGLCGTPDGDDSGCGCGI